MTIIFESFQNYELPKRRCHINLSKSNLLTHKNKSNVLSKTNWQAEINPKVFE